MSSLFDSKVYQRRNATPWAVVSLPAFLKDMALTGQAPVTVTCQYRPDAASRFWYTVEWTDEEGHTHRAEAQELDLALWRAAEIELGVRSKIAETDVCENGTALNQE